MDILGSHIVRFSLRFALRFSLRFTEMEAETESEPEAIFKPPYGLRFNHRFKPPLKS